MPGEPGPPRRPAQPPRPLREVGRASPAPPQARLRDLFLLLFLGLLTRPALPPACRQIYSSPPAAPSLTAEEAGGEGDVSITLSTLPLPRDGDSGPFPPDAGRSPGPTCGSAPAPLGPPELPQFPQPPRCEEGAGKAPGPGAPPAPRARGGEAAGRGLHTSLLKAFTASMSRRRREPGGFSPLMAAGPGQAGPGGGKSRSVRACAARSGAARPPLHGGWRRGRARGDAGPARFRLLLAPLPARRRRRSLPSLLPSLPRWAPGGRAGRRWRNNARRLRRGRQYGGHAGAPRSAAPERRRRLQRPLPGSACAARALPGWRPVRPARSPPSPPVPPPPPGAGGKERVTGTTCETPLHFVIGGQIQEFLERRFHRFRIPEPFASSRLAR